MEQCYNQTQVYTTQNKWMAAAVPGDMELNRGRFWWPIIGVTRSGGGARWSRGYRRVLKSWQSRASESGFVLNHEVGFGRSWELAVTGEPARNPCRGIPWLEAEEEG